MSCTTNGLKLTRLLLQSEVDDGVAAAGPAPLFALDPPPSPQAPLPACPPPLPASTTQLFPTTFSLGSVGRKALFTTTTGLLGVEDFKFFSRICLSWLSLSFLALLLGSSTLLK